MSWLNFDVEHALNGWAHEFLIKSSKIRGGFCRVCGGFCRVRGGFGRASISGQSITMLNISFRSRVFSSDSLMDGEAILANQVFDDMDVAALEAELNRLKDRFLGFVAVVVVAVVIVLVVIVSFNGLWVYRLFLFLVLSDARQSTNFGGAAFFNSFWTLKCLKNGTFKKWGMLSTGTFPWMRVSKLMGLPNPFSRPWFFFKKNRMVRNGNFPFGLGFQGATFFSVFGILFVRKRGALSNPVRSAKPTGKLPLSTPLEFVMC